MSDRRVAFSELAGNNLLEIGAGRPRSAGLDRFPLPILRVADVLEGGIQPSFQAHAPVTRSQEMGPKTSKPGDIVLTTKGTVGRVAVMPPEGPTFAYSPQLCYFRPIANGPLMPRYLYYWFKSEEFWNQADGLKGQTDMADFISLSDVHSLKMRIPPPEEQAAAIGVLGSLDDKIAANEQVVLLLDKWVRSSFTALTGELRPLGELASNIRTAVQLSDVEPGTRYYGLEHLPRRRMWASSAGIASDVTSAKSIFRPGDVLFGKLRPYFHKVVSVDSDGVCSTDILVVRPSLPDLAGFVLAACSSDTAVRACAVASEGTRMPRTSWKDLQAVLITWPGDSVAREFSAQVSVKSDLAHGLIRESRRLATLRDELLPPLMSGKIHVGEAGNIVEGLSDGV